MKNALLILCYLLLFFSCSKEVVFDDAHGSKLISIDYKKGSKAIDNWKVLFSYNEDDLITRVEDFYVSGSRFQIEYNNGRLLEYTTHSINDNTVAARDSISYNQNGSIKAIYNFTPYPEDSLTLSLIYEFEYSSENKLTEKKTYNVDQAEYISNEKYYWNNKNIEKSAYYDDEGRLRHETLYSYDNKINYKKNIPIYVSNPINWSENNIIRSNFADYTGAIDPSCYSCVTKYRYNLDLYPTLITYDWGTQLRLTYE